MQRDLERQVCGDDAALPAYPRGREAAAGSLDALPQTGDAGAAAFVDVAVSIVAAPDGDLVWVPIEGEAGVCRRGVAGDVRQRLGCHEVDGRLNRGGDLTHVVDLELDVDRRTDRERADRRLEP